MSLWDTAPLEPIIEEAGGRFFDWQGTATINNRESVAIIKELAEQVLTFTKCDSPQP